MKYEITEKGIAVVEENKRDRRRIAGKIDSQLPFRWSYLKEADYLLAMYEAKKPLTGGELTPRIKRKLDVRTLNHSRGVTRITLENLCNLGYASMVG